MTSSSILRPKTRFILKYNGGIFLKREAVTTMQKLTDQQVMTGYLQDYEVGALISDYENTDKVDYILLEGGLIISISLLILVATHNK
jgi:hypothetical protein